MSRFQENMDLLGIRVTKGDYANARGRYDNWLQSIPVIHRVLPDTDRNLLLDLVDSALDNTMATMTEMAARTKFQGPVSNMVMVLLMAKVVQEIVVEMDSILSEALARAVATLLAEAGPDELMTAMKEACEYAKARMGES